MWGSCLNKLEKIQLIIQYNTREILPTETGFHDVKKEVIMEREERKKLHKEREETMVKAFNSGSKPLTRLKVGDRVRIRNKITVRKIRWDRTGTVVRVFHHTTFPKQENYSDIELSVWNQDHCQYEVEVDGVMDLTLTVRDRKQLRKIASNTQDRGDDASMDASNAVRERKTVEQEEDPEEEMEETKLIPMEKENVMETP